MKRVPNFRGEFHQTYNIDKFYPDEKNNYIFCSGDGDAFQWL